MASNSSSQPEKNRSHVPPSRLGTDPIAADRMSEAQEEPSGQRECYYYAPANSPHHRLQNHQHQHHHHHHSHSHQQHQNQLGWPSRMGPIGPWLGAMTAYRLLTISLLIGILCPHHVHGVDPKFDPTTRMRLVLVPADAQVNSVIYRLRATDEEFDYPLTFEFVGDASASTNVVKVESLPCTKYNSVCQANIVLQRRLEPGRYYDFTVSVKDSKGGMATQLCSITATNFTTPHDLIFPHKPGIIMIPEVRTLSNVPHVPPIRTFQLPIT